MGEQAENLERVRQKTDRLILEIFRIRMVHALYEFHMNALVDEVCGFTPRITYDSCSRVLRMLRQQGAVGYVVANRKESLYRLQFVKRPDGVVLMTPEYAEAMKNAPRQMDLFPVG